jgi:hypothetical protein
MPFTPFHFGPGALLKALGGRRFSLVGFGVAQVAIDIEPGLGLLRGADVLHGWTHTFVGATVLGAAAAAVTLAIGPRVLRARDWLLRREGLAHWSEGTRIGALAAASGALLGAWSHVLLDGVMHSDLHPFAPWSQAQPWWRLVGIGTLHWLCVAAGVLGVAGWIARRRRRGAEESAR